jgi:hypothetical protein
MEKAKAQIAFDGLLDLISELDRQIDLLYERGDITLADTKLKAICKVVEDLNFEIDGLLCPKDDAAMAEGEEKGEKA